MARVTLERVSVEFPIYGSHRSLRKALFERAAGGVIRREGTHHELVLVNALEDISLDLTDGDRLGLVGHNGAGKTTLLKVIAGIYEPVRGKIAVEGQATPLFDALPGLDAEATGYENIVTAGLLLGMTRQEIELKIPQIEEFSELGEYLSLPVRIYSTGMIARLGFSVATAVEPDILLMDEGIATGDAGFGERAAERMRAFIGRSHIVVLASHTGELIRATCNKAALMHAGRLVTIGSVEEVFARYRTETASAAEP